MSTLCHMINAKVSSLSSSAKQGGGHIILLKNLENNTVDLGCLFDQPYCEKYFEHPLLVFRCFISDFKWPWMLNQHFLKFRVIRKMINLSPIFQWDNEDHVIMDLNL